MKVLIYTASSLCNPQFGIQMEHAIDFVNRGCEVVFCYCDGLMNTCSANHTQNDIICKLCKLTFSAGLKHLPSKIRIVGMKPGVEDDVYMDERFKTLDEIKAYQYKGVDLGYAVMSLYVTKTRNPKPRITESFLRCINSMLREAVKLVDAADNLILKENPDLIMFFNGRFFDTKPFYNLAKKHHIDFVLTENIGGVRADEEYRMVTFENKIPHDSKTIYENCLQSWAQSTRTEEEKTKIGIDFYERRRGGKRAGDYAYTASQIPGKLPDGFDNRKKNIVVFTSSEDEYSSISEEIDRKFLFSSQYEAIKFLSENINDNEYHFTVRIHPNMKGLNVEYHRCLYKLRDLNNVTIISPEETVSSYALMDVAYNIVLFGSTIGAESLFWGKSVVLLGHAEYDQWGVCDIPRCKDDIIKMVKEPKIFPEAKEIAIKYGYYFLENSLGKSSQYVKITPKGVNFLGMKIYVFEYLKIWNSSLIYKLLQTIYTRLLSHFSKNRINFPDYY